MGNARRSDLVKYLFALVLCGSNGIVAAYIDLPADQVPLLRALIGFVTLAVVLLVRNRGTQGLAARSHPREVPFLLGSGAALGTGWILLFRSYQMIGVGVTTLIYYLGPVLVMALSPLLFGTRLNRHKVLGFAVVAGGAVLIGSDSLSSSVSAPGLFLASLTTLCYALMVFCTKRVSHIHGLENATIQLGGSLAAVAVLFVASGDRLVAVPASSVAPVLVIGLVNTAVELYTYYTAIDALPVQSVAVLGYLEPLSAVVLSTLVLGEPFGPSRVIGTACILGGAVWCELVGSRADAAPQGEKDAELARAGRIHARRARAGRPDARRRAAVSASTQVRGA